MDAHTFSPSERLSARKQITGLQLKGNAKFFSPLLVKSLLCTPDEQEKSLTHKVLFVVPKRFLARATDRIKMKRRMREAYRLHKHRLPPLINNNQYLLLAYHYQSKNLSPYAEVSASIDSSITWLGSHYAKTRI